MNGIAAILQAFNEEVSIGSVVLRTKRYADWVIVIRQRSKEPHCLDGWACMGWGDQTPGEQGKRSGPENGDRIANEMILGGREQYVL